MRKKIAKHKKMLISDVVYILLQPAVSYFAFGKGCKNITETMLYLLTVTATGLVVLNLHCQIDYWNHLIAEAKRANKSPWRFAISLCLHIAIWIVPVMAGAKFGV